MAGGGVPTASRGGRKGVDFSVNLVPTIDLLSVLIAFLLITAVWAQISRIQVTQRAPGGAHSTAAPARSLVLRLDPGRAALAFSDAPPEAAGEVLAFPEGGLAGPLRAAVPRLVAPGTPRPPVQILAGDGVEYRTIITALDTLADFGLTSVRVGPSEGAGLR